MLMKRMLCDQLTKTRGIAIGERVVGKLDREKERCQSLGRELGALMSAGT